MGKISHFRSPTYLLARRTITVGLPEFLLRAFECRIAEANEGADDDDRVELEQIIEMQLAEALSLGEVAHLERQIQGPGAHRWPVELQCPRRCS